MLAERRPESLVQEKVLGRGHSTPVRQFMTQITGILNQF
jgi:hypothetical protein